MSESKRPKYKHRSVQEWLDMASEGLIALPNFQRSYVWSNDRKADYLKALLQNHPAGMIMVLECSEDAQFESRNFYGIDMELTKRPELILDGQQRITSLWHMLVGDEDSKSSFYIEVESLALDHPDFSVKEVIHFPDRSKDGKAHRAPKHAFEENRVPVKILWGEGDDWPLRQWCTTIYDGSDRDAHRIEVQLKEKLRDRLLQEELYYCELPDTTSRESAVDIFVNTNVSSVRITEFDIMAAYAEDWHEEDLRNRIGEYYSTSDHVRYYFDLDEEKYIPSIGTALLKTACLKINKPPKIGNYKDAVKAIFKDDTNNEVDYFYRLCESFDKALLLVSQHGGPTKRTLPSWPPVYVIAALQSKIATIVNPDKLNTVNDLLSSYIWHSFLSRRHESQVDDKIHEDYEDLCKCIEQLSDSYHLDSKIVPKIFDEEDYPLISKEDLESLERPLPWISGSSRLARGLAAFIMSKSPIDWVTGQELNWIEIRELEAKGKLERHHIFPRGLLNKIYKPKKDEGKISHGLNGVLTSKISNRAMSDKDPSKYLQDRIDKSSSLNLTELQKRVESHFVPFESLMQHGYVKRRYQKFIKDRAKWMGDVIKDQSEKTKNIFLG